MSDPAPGKPSRPSGPRSTGAADCGRRILETERLVLREMTQDDFPALCALLQDPAVMYASIIRDTNEVSQSVARRNGMSLRGTFVKHYRGVDMPHVAFSVTRAERDGVY